LVEFNWNKETMSPNQYKIADYIQKNTQLVLLSTEQEISDALDLSIASVSRFWRSAGYKNFKEFKFKMKNQLEATPAGKMKNIINRMEGQELQKQTLTISMNHLEKTLQHFSPSEFEHAVHALTSANRIYLYSPGPSKGLGELMHYRMSRFGLSIAHLDRNGSEIFEDLIHLGQDDLVVIFGFIRLLPEAKVILEYSKTIGYKTLLITDQLVSDFTDLADIVLFVSRGELWEFHSMIAPTYMIENLIIATGMKNKAESLKNLEELSQLRQRFASELPR
jgi:DNA-binding MurR/RpiR family transcriptional regulator